jgi:hypothetical protein
MRFFSASRTISISVLGTMILRGSELITFCEYSQGVLTKRIDAWTTTSIDSDRMQEKDNGVIF